MTSQWFAESELKCHCGCEDSDMDKTFLAMLDALREKVGPLTLSSAKRCANYNRKIGGAKNSAHVLGMAADIECSNSHRRYVIVKAAFEVGFRRIEWGTPTWIHVDAATESTGHPQDTLFLPG